MKTAVITGAFGQDGFFLTQFLLSTNQYEKIICTGHRMKDMDDMYHDPRIHIEKYDITNQHEPVLIIKTYKPDEFYHLASFSAPIVSWDDPEFVLNINAMSTVQLLDAIRMYSPQTKLFFASSAKIFGKPVRTPQDENTPVDPQDPYSLGKYTAHQAVKMYRNQFKLYACNGIMYNHESYLKSLNFVTRKICYYAVQLKKGVIESFDLLNLNPLIDLGDPRDYAVAMHHILQQEKSSDYIIATNSSISIREICKLVGELLDIKDIFSHINLPAGEVDSIEHPKNYYQGDNSKLLSIGWKPQYKVKDTIQEIIEYDLAQIK